MDNDLEYLMNEIKADQKPVKPKRRRKRRRGGAFLILFLFVFIIVLVAGGLLFWWMQRPERKLRPGAAGQRPRPGEAGHRPRPERAAPGPGRRHPAGLVSGRRRRKGCSVAALRRGVPLGEAARHLLP